MMSDEIRIQNSLTVINGNLRFPQLGGAYSRDQTTAKGGNPGTVALASGVEEDIAFGDVTPGEVFIQNLDDTAIVTYGPKSGGALVDFNQIGPGEHKTMTMVAGATLRVRADAICSIYVAGFST
jgi:hypothetical protein